ncbi:MAG: hypothetical protein WC140_06715 [Bacteroidales bacterium]
MKTTFRYSKNVWAFNSWLIIITVLIILSFFLFKNYIILRYFLLALCIPSILQIIYNLRGKIVVNEEKGTLKITNHRKILDIQQISQIETRIDNKGRVKKILVRVPPNSFFAVDPYDQKGFLNYMKKINPRIEFIEKEIQPIISKKNKNN